LSVKGLRLFLVEDEALVLFSLQDMVCDLGCEVACSAMTIGEALGMAQQDGFDAGILDVNVAGVRIDPVADILAQRRIPFLFTTGYDRKSLPGSHREAILLSKPYAPADLERALQECLAPGR
jgi:CheY-like chemotaxis protein